MEGIVLHDRDLIEFALVAAEKHKLKDFKVPFDCYAPQHLNRPKFQTSEHWLHNFKSQNHIVSRKIIKFVSVKRHENVEALEESIHTFMEELKPVLKATSPARVFNCDQTGLNLELTSGRTLFEKGAKRVEMSAQRIQASSHSFSLQPVISAA